MSPHPARRWHKSKTHLGAAFDIGSDRNENIALVHGPTEGGPEDFEAIADMFVAAHDLLASIDPDTLDAVADEIQSFEHSARCASLRGIAKRQRAAIVRATPQRPTMACEAEHDNREWIDCWQCFAAGQLENCPEDTCCCLYPPCMTVECDECNGKRGWYAIDATAEPKETPHV